MATRILVPKERAILIKIREFYPNNLSSFTGSIQNVTIEERVSLLEIQVVEIQEDVTDVDERVTLVEGDVDFLFDEQVIQDERLLELEQTSDDVVVELSEVNLDLLGKNKQTNKLTNKLTNKTIN